MQITKLSRVLTSQSKALTHPHQLLFYERKVQTQSNECLRVESGHSTLPSLEHRGARADHHASGALRTQQTTWKFIVFIALN